MPLPPRLSFSTQLPTLQIAWDSTSIGALKLCPRYYQLSIIEGYAPRDESVHLTFGIRYHEALEAYDKAKAQGASHKTAMRVAVRKALTDTWDHVKQRPWFSDHKNKNRETLIRTIVWYLDKFEDDNLKTIILANGQHAVELSFRMSLERTSKTTKEEMLLCGHMDKLVEFGEHAWIADHKTTAYTLDENFFEKFTPDNQFSVYMYAGKVIYPRPLQGLIVSAAQVAITFSRFQRSPITRTPSQLEEWRKDLDWWLDSAEYFATQNYWPMNDKSCGMYGGCQFRKICGKAPSSREDWLKHGFHTRVWDPLKVRGDI